MNVVVNVSCGQTVSSSTEQDLNKSSTYPNLQFNTIFSISVHGKRKKEGVNGMSANKEDMFQRRTFYPATFSVLQFLKDSCRSFVLLFTLSFSTGNE